jgi:methyltransferase (TIGR00027 family)
MMSPDLKKRIETKTSRTAEWVCLCRAISSLEKDNCYRSDDRVALSLLPHFLRLLIHIPFVGRLFLRVFAARGIYEYVIARTKYIDAVFRQALSDQFSQILLFGAGFDTRALRFQEEARQTKIFELDAPATQEAKLAQYKKRHLSIPPNAVFVPIDFDRESLPLKLGQAGFRTDERSLFILEGVLEYLQPQSVDQTFRTIRELAGAGSEVVFNYIYASATKTCTMAKKVRSRPWQKPVNRGTSVSRKERSASFFRGTVFNSAITEMPVSWRRCILETQPAESSGG